MAVAARWFWRPDASLAPGMVRSRQSETLTESSLLITLGLFVGLPGFQGG